MTDEEVQQAIQDSIELEQEWLEQQHQKPKSQRTRKIEPRMLRTPEAAQYIGVSEWQLRQMVASGEIAFIKRKYFLFSVDDLDAWIKRNREREVL
jgi:excisionase family DNA binding protein